MNKKDFALIGGLLAVALVLFVAFQFFFKKTSNLASVQHGQETILQFDISKDAEYEIHGDYGVLIVEVKDHQWRITREECPNHVCSRMGWASLDNPFPIVCLPNNIVVMPPKE